MIIFKNYLRRIVQFVFFVYIIGIGLRFFFYVEGKVFNGFILQRPPGVEGFLPISALLGLRQLVETRVFDVVHPAGLTILITAIAMSILVKRSFCSHICPVGFVSELLTAAGKRFVIPFYVPVWVIKYLLLGFFIYIVFISMDIRSVAAFISSPYNVVSDFKMLKLFLPPSITTVVVLTLLVLFTLVFRNFWCKYLCPYGALLGLLSVLSPVKVKRNKDACISCHRCSDACPQGIAVHKKNTVHSPDCMGCNECIKNRYSPACLDTTMVRYRYWIPVAVAALFIIGILAGMLSGHWDSVVTDEQYRRFMMMNIPRHY